MHRMRALVLVTMFALLQACASAPTPEKSSKPAPTEQAETDQLRKALQEAVAPLAKEDYATSEPLLRAVLESPAFPKLSDTERYVALYAAGAVASELLDKERAHELFKRATAIDKVADGDAWIGRVESGFSRSDIQDVLFSLTTLTRRWPESLSQLDDVVIFRTAWLAQKLPDNREAYFECLDALYRAGWTGKSGREPADLWSELTLMLLERKDVDRAVQVAARATTPYVLIGMRVDKRFEPVVKANPERFDIDRAVVREIADLRKAVERSPRSLEVLLGLTSTLLAARKYEEVLKLTYEASTRALSATRDAAPYDDADRYLIWVMNDRSSAFAGLNRHEEAADELVRARRYEEFGGKNVSQAINLAYRYSVMGRSKDALDALGEVGTEMTSFGAMHVEAVRLAAAVQMKNAPEVARSLAFMREHRADAPSAFLWALVRANQIDEAAAWLITRLEDPRERLAALLDIQQYAESTPTPAQSEWRVRWKKLIARQDVQSAVEKVGKIERFNLEAQGGD